MMKIAAEIKTRIVKSIKLIYWSIKYNVFVVVASNIVIISLLAPVVALLLILAGDRYMAISDKRDVIISATVYFLISFLFRIFFTVDIRTKIINEAVSNISGTVSFDKFIKNRNIIKIASDVFGRFSNKATFFKYTKPSVAKDKILIV